MEHPALYVDIVCDTVLDPETDDVLPVSKLKKGKLARMHWETQTSGVGIPDDVAETLEVLWSRFIEKPQYRHPASDPKALEGPCD